MTNPGLLHARLVDQYADHYQQIIAIFKGVSLFAAAAALHSIFSEGATLGVKLNALGFWLGSFATMLVTYDSIMVTTIVTVARPNVLDVLAPFVLGLGEFLQFTVLTLSAGPAGLELLVEEQLSQIAWWPLVAALTGLAGCGLMANYERHLVVSMQHSPPQLDPGYRQLAKNLRSDKIVTLIFASLLLAALAVLRWGWPGLRRWEGIVGFLAFAGSTGSLWNYEVARRKFTDAFAAPPVEAPAPAAEATVPAPDPPV